MLIKKIILILYFLNVKNNKGIYKNIRYLKPIDKVGKLLALGMQRPMNI